MNRRTKERRQSAATLGQIICACNEAKLRATIDAQELLIQQMQALLAKVGSEIALIPWMQRSIDLNVLIADIDNILPKPENNVAK